MLTITDGAAQKINELVQKDLQAGNLGEHWCLFFSVIAGGCAGLQYDMRFVEMDHGDILDINSIPVYIPEKAVPFTDGIIIDWANGLMESGFKLTNTNAEASCGCGKSFK